MKKLVLTLALVFGVLAANAQYFVGGQFGLLYDDASENTMITMVMHLTILGRLPV